MASRRRSRASIPRPTAAARRLAPDRGAARSGPADGSWNQQPDHTQVPAAAASRAVVSVVDAVAPIGPRRPLTSTPKASRRTSCSSTPSRRGRSRGQRNSGSTITARTSTTRSRPGRSSGRTWTSSSSATTPRAATCERRSGASPTPKDAGDASPTRSFPNGTS